MVEHLDRPTGTSQRFLTLPEEPAAIRSSGIPAAAADVRSMQVAGGVATFVVYAARGARDSDVPGKDNTEDTVQTLAWNLRDGTWSTRRQFNKVTAFALAADSLAYAVAAGGRVLIDASDAGSPEQHLTPSVTLTSLTFSGDDDYLLGFAPGTDRGGTVHVWRRRDGVHWAAAIETAPSALAVTRDGTVLLAAGADGEATRAGRQVQLSRWNLSVPGDRVSVTVGRSLRDPASICGLLAGSRAREAAGARVGVNPTDVAECSPVTNPTPAWAVSVADERQLTVLAPRHAAVAKIDHATKVLHGAVSPDGASAVTLDEGGHVQLFPVTAKALMAQACQRQPAPLSGALRALLPPESQEVDACGRREEKSQEDDAR